MSFKQSPIHETPPTDNFARPQTARRLLQLAVKFTSVAVLATAIAAGPSMANAETTPPLSVTTTDAVQEILTNLQAKSSDTDVRYLQDSVWIDGNPDCFHCTVGPSLLAAARGRAKSPDAKLFNVSVATTDKAIKDHQRADGAITPAAPGEGGPDIQTVLFANQLAQTYLVLGDQLDASHRVAWSNSLAKSADFLIGNGNLSWYINGNINLAMAINMDLTYRITGLSRFQTAAQTALSFALDPPQARWPGFGLKYSTSPTSADGSDGAGYLAESGSARTPGFDPSYTGVQVDMASMWYLLTNNPTAKRLTNLMYNQLAPRVRTSDWTFDVSGGTRHNTPGERFGFAVSAVSVLALKGGRTDLQGMVQSQVTKALAEYKYSTKFADPGLSYNLGIELGAIYLVVTNQSIATPSPAGAATVPSSRAIRKVAVSGGSAWSVDRSQRKPAAK